MLNQFAIALTGCIAIWLSQDTRASHRRWACIFGLIGQPFWFYAAWQAGQWGIFALSFIYTASWLKGLWNNWLVPARSTEADSLVKHSSQFAKFRKLPIYANRPIWATAEPRFMEDAVHPNEAAFNAEFKAFTDSVKHSPLPEGSDPEPSIFMLQAALNASREYGEIEGTGLYLLPPGHEMFAAARVYQAMTAEAKS